MLESIVFHSRLSSIMEQLVVSAVTEINKLMSDYCAVLRMELSREKQENHILRDKLRGTRINANQGAHNDPNNDQEEPRSATKTETGGEELQLDQRPSCAQKEVSEWNNGAAEATDTGASDEQGPLRLTDCKLDPGIVKHEVLHGKPGPTGEPDRDEAGESSTSPLVSQQQQSLEQGTSFQVDWQFHSLPPEDSHDLNKDATQHNVNISSSLNQLVDVGFTIKTEPDSPNLNPPNLGEDASSETDLELHRGMMGQMYPDYGTLSLESSFFDVAGPGPYTFSLPSKPQHTLTATDSPDMALISQHVSNCDLSSHNGNQTQSVSSNNGTSCRSQRATDGMRYVCQSCGKGFPFLSTLKHHQLKHTGERTQHCGQCGKSFIRRSHLRRHELLHTGLRPFACQFCGRRFSRDSHLKAHMKIHRK